MAELKCPNEDKYLSKDGRWCDRCCSGSHVKADCDDTKATRCAECGRGLYTATRNHLSRCHVCRVCSPINNQRNAEDCTPQKNAVCECMPDYYCSNDQCDHCRPVRHCPPGEGVTAKVTRTHDAICAPCEEGTYSNVTDSLSPCRPHTRCEDIGRVLETPGTRTTDAICGDFISRWSQPLQSEESRRRCSPQTNFEEKDTDWILPTGLWSGLVLMALVLFGLICWREKRKSYRAARPIVPVSLNEMVPATPDSPLDLPSLSTELRSDYPESCAVDGCELPLFHPDVNVVGGSTRHSLDSCPPIPPLKASVSFAGTSQSNGGAGYCTGNFRRTVSEPQEDEWYGT